MSLSEVLFYSPFKSRSINFNSWRFRLNSTGHQFSVKIKKLVLVSVCFWLVRFWMVLFQFLLVGVWLVLFWLVLFWLILFCWRLACAVTELNKKYSESPEMARQLIEQLFNYFYPHQTLVPKISASVDGSLSGGSRMRRPGSEGPHRR